MGTGSFGLTARLSLAWNFWTRTCFLDLPLWMPNRLEELDSLTEERIASVEAERSHNLITNLSDIVE